MWSFVWSTGGKTRGERCLATHQMTEIEPSTTSTRQGGSLQWHGNCFQRSEVLPCTGVTAWHKVKNNYTWISEWNIQQCVVIEMNYTFSTTRTSVQEWDLMFFGLRRVGIWDKTVWKIMEGKKWGTGGIKANRRLSLMCKKWSLL